MELAAEYTGGKKAAQKTGKKILRYYFLENPILIRPCKSADKNLIFYVGYNPFNSVAMKSRNHAAAINQNAWTVTNAMATNLDAMLMTAKINDKNQMIFFGGLSLIRTSDFLSNFKYKKKFCQVFLPTIFLVPFLKPARSSPGCRVS
ncbi:MAG: hypothetical protein QG657_3992 [Acidobacteriota bacterium]|nr:hypothetical protein [Acidobacteriota bacterium]